MDPVTRKEMFLAKAAGQEVVPPDPVTREEMFLAQIAQNGGGASSWNDLKDKPFYTEIAEILPETTVEIGVEETGVAAIPHEFTLEPGKEYTITYNGVKYVSRCVKLEEPGGDVVIIGNAGAVAEGLIDTGEPFVIVYDDSMRMVAALDGSTSVTLSISGEKVTKIPGQYLPDGVGYDKTATLVDAQEVVFNNAQNGTVITAGDLVAGASYTVIYNGTEYKCVAATDSDGRVYIGDLLTGGAAPFYISLHTSTPNYMAVVTDGNQGDKLVLTITGTVRHKIPDKYFDSRVMYVDFDANAVMNDGETIDAFSCSIDEIKQAIGSGISVILRGKNFFGTGTAQFFYFCAKGYAGYEFMSLDFGVFHKVYISASNVATYYKLDITTAET